MTQVCDMLPPVRGTYTQGAPLKDLVWFRAGGAAEILFREVLIAVARIFARQAVPVVVAALDGELVRVLRLVGDGSRRHQRQGRHDQHPHLVLLVVADPDFELRRQTPTGQSHLV